MAAPGAEDAPGRTVLLNQAEETFLLGGRYKGNSISTTKYNLATFLPKGLFEQFRRVANLYFLAVAGLSLTPFSPVSYYTTWAPLLLVVGISMLKEGLEDYKRYKQDCAQNASLVDAFGEVSGDRVTVPWSALRPGDVVVVLRDEFFPADLLFLASSHPEGSCYVETMNLDGETNLKLKKCVDATAGLKETDFAGWRAAVECDAPNSSLYTFQGNLLPAGGVGDKVPLGPSSVLLRGSNLRNTEWVMGAVLYAGHDTKVMKNSSKAPSKRSTVERRLDYIIVFMLTLLFTMCLAGSVYLSVRTQRDAPRHWYLAPHGGDTANRAYDPDTPAAVGAYAGITQFILYGYLIPISLYVSIELVKVAQSMYFINFDMHMYDAESDTPALARTSNLNEELGQVATILSDKTGTLTRNTMEFFKCSVGGVKYGSGVTDIERTLAAREGKPLPPAEPGVGSGKPPEKGFNFVDDRLLGPPGPNGEAGPLAWPGRPDADTIRRFLLLLAVCHTVIPEGEPTPGAIKYQAESPDEFALVVAAKRLGFFFKRRTGAGVTLEEPPPPGAPPGAPPVEAFYEVLAVLEFNSTRKRMSVIVRAPPAAGGGLMLLTKGADSVIYERLAPDGSPFRHATAAHTDEFAQAGLRTLCLAWAPLEEGAYAQWAAAFFAAKTSLVDRDAKLAEAAEAVEKDLLLLGATAVEDKLQEGVPATIEHLAAAGVALWVLTGDKQDTAINIGMACSLLRPGMEVHIISLEALVAAAGGRVQDRALRDAAAASVGEQLGECLAALGAAAGPGGGGGAGGGSGGGAAAPVQHALVIDGFGLTFALSEQHVDAFWRMASGCGAVICCRVSPLQKALVTGLVKSKGKVTLAVGDGANDVGMIQAAHIGVGISGKEGQQAVMAADFAIGQFRFLERLVLVHGRWNYKRNARLVCYFFYKNMYFGFTIFWYNAWAFFSGQPCYNDYAMSCYNLFFTSLPIIVVAVLDQDVAAPVSHHFPQLYSQGQRNDYFTWRVIAYWALNGFYQSIATFLACFFGQYRLASDHPHGQVMEMWGAGSAMYTVVVVTVTLQLALVINYFTALHHLIFWFSVSLKYIFILIIGSMKPSFSTGEYGLFLNLMAPTPSYWLLVPVVASIALLPDFVFRAVRRTLYPADHEIVQEAAALFGHNPPPRRRSEGIGGAPLGPGGAGGEGADPENGHAAAWPANGHGGGGGGDGAPAAAAAAAAAAAGLGLGGGDAAAGGDGGGGGGGAPPAPLSMVAAAAEAVACARRAASAAQEAEAVAACAAAVSVGPPATSSGPDTRGEGAAGAGAEEEGQGEGEEPGGGDAPAGGEAAETPTSDDGAAAAAAATSAAGAAE